MLDDLIGDPGPHERCGIIRAGQRVEMLNVALDPEASFAFRPIDTLLLEDEQTTATWHTHPNEGSEASKWDKLSFSAWPDLDHYVVGKNTITRYKLVSGQLVAETWPSSELFFMDT